MPHARDERLMALLARPFDCLLLRLGSVQRAVGVIFNNVFVDRIAVAAADASFATGNVYGAGVGPGQP
jgi:hypothetical protein